MNIDEIKVGMHVIPVSSTHPKGEKMEYIYDSRGWGHMRKGYLIVCEVRQPGNDTYYCKTEGMLTVLCHEKGRMMAWGNSNQYRWMEFLPEDLVPVTPNETMRLKYMQGG